MSWAAIAAAGITTAGTVGMGLYGQHQAEKNQGGAMPSQYIEPTPFQPGVDLATGQSKYATDLLGSLSEGADTPYWAKAEPRIRAGMEQDLYRKFYGGSLYGTGLMQEAEAGGARFGTGPKPTTDLVGKAMAKYSDESTAIDQFLATQGVNVSMEGQRQAMGKYLPIQMQGFGMQGQQMGARPDYLSGAIKGFGASMPYLTQGLQGLNTQQTQMPNLDYGNYSGPVSTNPAGTDAYYSQGAFTTNRR